MHEVLKREQRPLLAVFGAVLLVAAAIGTWTGGQHGALTAVGGVVIGALIFGLLGTMTVPMFEDNPVDWFVVLAGAVLIVGGVAITLNNLLPALGSSGRIASVAVVVTATGAGAGFVGADGVVRGAGYGLLAGALGGLLFVSFATYESFTMRPALDTIVLLSGVLGPLVFGIVGGIGGVVGGSLHTLSFADGSSN